MSKRSKHKKRKAQNYKEPCERPEKSQAEEPQVEKTQPEEPQTEKSQPEEPQAEEPQTEEPQAEKPQAEEPQQEQLKTKKKQRIVMSTVIVLAVIMVIAASLVLLHNRWFKKPELPSGPVRPTGGIEPSAAIPPPSGDPDPMTTPDIVTVEPLAGGERRSKDFFTVLIFGADEVSELTDTIMVASYDVTNQKAAVLSIPRDTLVNNRYLDGASKSINATYKQNGMGESGVAALKTEVSRLLGFVPDFYVTINWELVGKMVDAIDGVEFEVPWRMIYDDPTQDLHIDLKAGVQTLDGEHAMQLVRWRYNSYGIRGGGDNSDLSRLNLQHDFLKAVLRKTLQPQNIVRVPELIRLFNENVVSDLTVENMLWFGQEAVLGGLSADDVEFLTMPVYGTDNTSARYYGKVCPITNQLLTVVNNSLNPYVEDVTLLQLDLIQMSADGNILSSTTGTLRNPSAGVFEYPEDPEDPTESDPAEGDPTESDPTESDPTESDPAESDPSESDPSESDPSESDPTESDPSESDPTESDPSESDPSESDPSESDPPESDPVNGGSDPGQTDDPPPETGPALPEVDGPADGDWGYTPD